MLEETDKMRRRRIARTFAGWSVGIIFTLTLLTIDAVIVFTPDLLHVTMSHPEHEKMTISFGPLFTKLCSRKMENKLYESYNNDTLLTYKIPFKSTSIFSDTCIKMLFYQLPIDDYVGPVSWQSITVIVAYWVPLVISLLCMRATFMILHPYLQFICSVGYIGVIVIMFDTIGMREEEKSLYTYGFGMLLILVRMAICTVTMIVVTCILVFRACMIKYDICGCGNDEPILIGVGYNDHEDPSKQAFWSPMRTEDMPIKRRDSYQSIDLGDPVSIIMSESV